MRTEYNNGMLFFVHGAKGVYFLIQLVSGGIHWEWSDGDVRQVFIFPQDKVEGGICDGQWHTLRLIKFGSELSIVVDFRFSESNGGDRKAAIGVDLDSNMYIGGIKSGSIGEAFIIEQGLEGIQTCK